MAGTPNATQRKPWRATPRVNLAIDVMTGLVFAALASTGMVLEWRLPHGGKHGRWDAPTWLALGRHGWGDVHFWLSVLAVALVVAHVVLHWAWIRACWPKLVHRFATPVGLLTLGFVVVLLAAPWVIPPG